jgi:hypothetical protein
MSGRVFELLPLIMRGGNHPRALHDDRADGNFILSEGLLGFGEGQPHEPVVRERQLRQRVFFLVGEFIGQVDHARSIVAAALSHRAAHANGGARGG